MKYETMTLQEVVEELYPSGWDEFIVDFSSGFKELDESDIISWNDKGDIPDIYYRALDSMLTIDGSQIEYAVLQLADPTPEDEDIEEESEDLGDVVTGEAWDDDFDDIDDEEFDEFDGDDIDDEEEEDQGKPEPKAKKEKKAKKGKASEGFVDTESPSEDPESEVAPIEEPKETETIEEPEEIIEEPVEEPEEEIMIEDLLDEEEKEVETQSSPVSTASQEDTGENLRKAVVYTEMLLSNDSLRPFFSRLAAEGGKSSKKEDANVENIVFSLMRTNLDSLTRVAKELLESKKKGSVHLGVWVGMLDAANLNKAEILYGALVSTLPDDFDETRQSNSSPRYRHMLAGSFDSLSDEILKTLEEFANLPVI